MVKMMYVCVLSCRLSMDYIDFVGVHLSVVIFQAIIALRDRFAEVFKPGIITWV